MEPLAPGDPAEIAGYVLRARLGAGGMGRVYLADTRGGRPVALKLVRPEFSDDAGFRDRFRHEVAAARRVHGLYTAQVLDADPDAPRPWLVTAYVAGPSVQQAVSEHGPMPAGTVLVLAAGVAEALQAIHAAGVVHRDLKPSNVLLAADGPRVIDFGIARATATALTRTGMRVGSPQYMAPEQVSGTAVTPAIDVFALGGLAAFAALGRPPFGADTEAAVLYRVLHEPPDLAGCPEPVHGLVLRCLARRPADRPTLDEIITQCRAGTAGKALDAARSWLPPAVAASLARYPDPAPADLPATLAPPAPTATGPLAGSAAAAAADTAGLPGAGQAATRRRVPGIPVLAAAAAAVIALAVGSAVAAGVLGQRGPAGAAGRRAGLAITPARARTSPPASPGPSLAPGVDPCVVGTWTGTADDTQITINGQPVQAAGTGPTEIDLPDGTQEEEYGSRTVFTVTFGGNAWTEIIAGSATAHYEDIGGVVYLSDISDHGTWELLENGAYSNGGALMTAPQPYRYTCTGNEMREFFPAPSTGSQELTRKLPPPSQGS
jgi:hypothetical protein